MCSLARALARMVARSSALTEPEFASWLGRGVGLLDTAVSGAVRVRQAISVRDRHSKVRIRVFIGLSPKVESSDKRYHLSIHRIRVSMRCEPSFESKRPGRQCFRAFNSESMCLRLFFLRLPIA